jgi:acetolactate synthase-1/2/3 large subunit
MGKIKVSDYIVKFLISKGVTDVFGYPGGMVTHLMDSFDKYVKYITAHVNYNEQGSSFCACAYAQVSHKIGFAYATSGPGATNLITGIANAYYDSIPCMFVTGQVNTYEQKGDLQVRQRGFQEMNVVNITKEITKYSVALTQSEDVAAELQKAYEIAMSGRPGPIVLDIPMNIFREEIEDILLEDFSKQKTEIEASAIQIIKEIKVAKRPLIIAGAGINSSDSRAIFREFIEKNNIPVVTSMIGVDILPSIHKMNFGFIGAYGHRYANILTQKADLIISLGTRMDCRQTGTNKDIFATNCKFIRVDIDSGELTNKIKQDEIQYVVDVKELLQALNQRDKIPKKSEWLDIVSQIKTEFLNVDDQVANKLIGEISKLIPDYSVITTDVGQNQVWVAQSFFVKPFQRILFSGGHGAMGYSLPASIGAYYATKKPVICFTGDGGLMMNIQEMQFIKRENLPIKIVLLNNQSLGMIRHFQEMYFESNYVQTRKEKGYTAPDFEKIAKSYDIKYIKINHIDRLDELQNVFFDNACVFIDVTLSDTTYVFPKLAINKPIYDQEPLMDRNTLDEVLKR